MPPRKKAVASRDTTKKKSTKQSKSRSIDQPPVKEEEKIEEPPPPKPDSWLDHLPPVIKPDEELHKQLSAQRKAAAANKRQKICQDELDAMINFALKVVDFPEKQRKKKIKRLKIDFLAGNFIPQLPPKEPLQKAVSSSVSFVSGPQSPPSLQKLLQSKEYTLFEAINQLTRSASKSEFMFDGNPELDAFLSKLSTDMKPFSEPTPPPEPVDFPFVCCVVGPPCSGKTTICNFIKTFFNVLFIDNNSDENIPQKIAAELPNLPKGKVGLLLGNYPNTKAQLTALERALQTYSKSKHDNAQQFSQIHIMFRCALTYEEVEKQISGRLCSAEDETLIFHNTFNPPNVLQSKLKLIELPPPADLQQTYNKALQATSSFENITKRGGLYVQIQMLDNIDKLELTIENNIRQLYDQMSLPVPFTSFVNYIDNEKLRYAKLCYDIIDIWNKKCVPFYATELSALYMRTLTVKNQINYLVGQTREKFSLMLARPDSRTEMAENFKKSSEDYGKFFKEIWEKSIEVKDTQIAWTSEVLQKSGLSLLKGFMAKSEETIFISLIKRFLIVDWFFKTFKNLEDKSTMEKLNSEIPVFNISADRLSELCQLLKINKFRTEPKSQSSVVLPNPPEIHVKEPIQSRKSCMNMNNSFKQQSFQSIQSPEKSINEKDVNIVSKVGQNTINENGQCEQHVTEEDEDSLGPIKLKPKDEILKDFLEFLFNEMTVKTLRADAKLILQIYIFLNDEKKAIEKDIDQNIISLKNELSKWVDKKYSSEMESFAKKFRLYKSGEDTQLTLFNFDLSFVNNNEEIQKIIGRLGSKLPSVESQQSLPLEKVADLIKSIASLRKDSLNLTELLECGKKSNFTDDEIDILEIMARMTALTDFIDVKEFCLSLAPDSSVVPEFKEILESALLLNK